MSYEKTPENDDQTQLRIAELESNLRILSTTKAANQRLLGIINNDVGNDFKRTLLGDKLLIRENIALCDRKYIAYKRELEKLSEK